MVVQGFIVLYKVVHCFTMLYKVVKQLYTIVHSCTMFNKAVHRLQECILLYKVLHNCIWLHKGCTTYVQHMHNICITANSRWCPLLYNILQRCKQLYNVQPNIFIIHIFHRDWSLCSNYLKLFDIAQVLYKDVQHILYNICTTYTTYVNGYRTCTAL